jgi:parallel beta-helix repeat protein
MKLAATVRLVFGAMVATVALVSSAVGAAASGTLYVDRGNPSCSDAGSGTLSQPFCKIGAAAGKVAAGQTVEVATGTYPEVVTMVTSGTSTAPISFAAAPGATVTVSGQANGFVITGKSWISVAGFHVTNTTGYGIAVKDSARITLEHNRVSFSGKPVNGSTRFGVRLENTVDSVVAANTADHNTDAGIAVLYSSTRNLVQGNHTYENARGYIRAAPGIRLYDAPGNTVAGNLSHDNEDSGIEAYTGSNNTLLYNNVTYDNGDHGIDNLNATGQRIIANTVYRNVTAGINVEGSSPGATIRNNISVDNGINSPRTRSNIRVDSGSVSGTTMNDDLVHLTAANQVLLVWSSTSYNTLASFQAATGQEARGIQADPKWRDPAVGDFHLTAGSPAIDSANSGASGQPATDVEGNPRVDDPATPNTGIGPRTYDDRGAYEYQAGPPADAPPVAALTISPSAGTAPLTVSADSSASTDGDATPIATYMFDFGDGTPPVGPQAAATATHTYTVSGTFVVTVTVADTAGLTSTATATVEVGAVGDSPPAASLNVTPSSGAIPFDVTADASASTDGDGTPIASYRFDFGDGTPVVGPQTTATATHTYTASGMFTVTVTVTDTAGLASTATDTVQANAPSDAPPVAALTVTPASGSAPVTVTANASASTDTDATPIASYTFDFGDGSPTVGPQSAATATHVYLAAGTFPVTVTVRDTAGLSSTATATVTITDSPPSASLSVSPSSGRAPVSVVADGSGSTDADATPIATYSFDFGDGSPVIGPQTAATAGHTYSVPGTYSVKMTVTDTAGLSSTAVKKVKVR